MIVCPSFLPLFSLFPPCSQNDKLPGPFSAHKAHLSYRERAERERENVTREEGERRGGVYKKLLVGSETSSPVDSPLRYLSFFGLHISSRLGLFFTEFN